MPKPVGVISASVLKRTGRYTFMVTGPIVALGSLGTPLVLQGFRATDDLVRAKPHCFDVR